jgi:hypothetical protein
VVAKPLFAVCRHGPFCARCAAAVQRCTLPACVCRALLSGWREEQWPAAGPEDEPVAAGEPGENWGGLEFGWEIIGLYNFLQQEGI